MYRNKEWLYNKYINEKLSTFQIDKLCGVSPTAIRYWLVKYNIPRRSIGESRHLATNNHCNLSQDAIEWIDGELLGDGSLHKTSSYSALFSYSSKHLEYIEYVRDTLKSFGIEKTGKIYKQKDRKTGAISYSCGFRSYPELMVIYRRWYPNNKKIIPKDIKITPLTLRQHYIGDGSLTHSKKQKPYIRLATNGFKISDVNWLIKQLNKLGFKANRQRNGNVIRFLDCFTKDFLTYIGECPVKCYQYKWAI